jgi:hypothetical protein
MRLLLRSAGKAVSERRSSHRTRTLEWLASDRSKEREVHTRNNTATRLRKGGKGIAVCTLCLADCLSRILTFSLVVIWLPPQLVNNKASISDR